MWVHPLPEATIACGGKALGLARLIAAGLPVPEGFVLEDTAFRELAGDLDSRDETVIGHRLAQAAARIATAQLPDELIRDVEQRAGALGMLAVRSSATIEDGDAGAAAGVFSSRRAVPPAEVWDAIRAVWTSALTPLAAAYARRRTGPISIGVIVQQFVPGEPITVYTRAPGKAAADDVMIQRGGNLTVVPRSSLDPAVVLALRAEAAIGARQGADVELVGERIVQARPIVHPVINRRALAPPTVLAPLVADGRHWTWDVAHNPDPLSPAQAGLVAQVDRAAIAPYSLRVCAGYLYVAPRGEPAAAMPASSRDELSSRVAALEARLAVALGAELPPLDEAIARYLAFYRIWATELGPLIRATRASANRLPLTGSRPSSVEATLLATARGELDEATAVARLGVLSPAWDIAVPTYGERPGIVQEAIARARTIAATSAIPDDRGDDLAAAVADLAERDDAWFARAQVLMRRAVIARASELGIDPEDAFWIPLDDLAHRALDTEDVRHRASAARNAAIRAGQWAMPRSVGGLVEPVARALHGIGTGPRVTGRIVRFATLASTVMVGSADIVVTRTVTPALAVAVIGCAALVSETGGLLDHGAALARELGIPCVVGCHEAWSLLADGMIVTVDGDAGSVEIS